MLYNYVFISINVIVIIIVVCSWAKVMYKSKKLKNYDNTFEQELIKDIKSFEIKKKNIVNSNKYDNLFYASNVKIYSVSKYPDVVTSSQISSYFRSRSLFIGNSSKISTSTRQAKFESSLREFGIGCVKMGNNTITIISSGGNIVIRYKSLVYVDTINAKTIIIVEKNKKSIILNFENIKDLNSIIAICENNLASIKTHTQSMYVGLVDVLAMIKSKIDFKIDRIDISQMTVALKTESITQMCNIIINTIVFNGVYLYGENSLINSKQHLTKNNTVLKDQIKLSNGAYLNTSSNLSKINRVELLINTLESSKVDISKIIITYHL